MKTKRYIGLAGWLLLTATPAWSQISSLEELENGYGYLIKRVPVESSGNGLIYGDSNRQVWVTQNGENNDNNYWAIYTSPQTGQHFIYNLGQQTFLALGSEGSVLQDEATPMVLLPSPLDNSWMILNNNRICGLATDQNGVLLSQEESVQKEGMAFSFTRSTRKLSDEELQRITDKVAQLEGTQREVLLKEIADFIEQAKELEKNALPDFAGIYRYQELESAWNQADNYSDEELENLLAQAKESLYPQEGKFYHLLNKARPNADSFTANVLSVVDNPNVEGSMNLAGTPDGNQRPGTKKGNVLESLSLFQFTSTGAPGVFYLSNPGMGIYVGGEEGNGTHLPLFNSRTQAVPYELIADGTQQFRFRNAKYPSYYLTLNGESNAVSYDQLENPELWYLEEVKSLEIEIGETGYATLCLPCNIELPQEIEAYVAASVEGDELIMKPLKEFTQNGQVIPAFTPVVLRTSEENAGNVYECALNNESLKPVENLLQGITKHTTIDSGSYILANGSQETGFYLVDDNDRALAGNRAYLPGTAVGGQQRITLRFNDQTTVILNPETGTFEKKEQLYDLSGKRVTAPRKGIYISESGKKVVVK